MTDKEKEYRYSEIFRSIQGEGEFTGVPTLWLRFWGCNLECKGFGQENLDDPSTWKLPYKKFAEENTIDPNIIAMEDLPVWEFGCDSSYTWSQEYRHLAHRKPVSEIVDTLIDTLKSPYNPQGMFKHPGSGQETHMAFTGGEPMMSQKGMRLIMERFKEIENQPLMVTVETNGTRPIEDHMQDFLREFMLSSMYGGYIDDERGAPLWFWSVSPKLRSSGEKWDDAIKPEVVAQYAEVCPHGQLKFVVDNDDRTWYEVEKAVKEFREAGLEHWPVWIMPVGATKESQESEDTQAVAEEAIARGYNVSGRLHCYIWGNKLGT
jgi:organic radical activating enzyme